MGVTSEYLSLFPNHKFVLIPNAGHYINIEQHDMYISEIQGFLLH
jgi:pimeloyl-ACP methyl ester carboxylesterase